MNAIAQLTSAPSLASATIVALCVGLASPAVGQMSWPLWTLLPIPDSGVAQYVDFEPPVTAVAEACAYVFFPTTDPARSLVWSRTDDDGRSWTPLAPTPLPSSLSSRSPRVVAVGDDLFVHAPDYNGNWNAPDVAFSGDRGVTWTLHQAPMRWGVTGVHEVSGSIVMQYGGVLFVSADQGATWQGPRVIGAWSGQSFAYSPNLLAQDGVLHAVWESDPNGQRQLWYARSADLGQTWLPVGQLLHPVGMTPSYLNRFLVGDGWLAVVGTHNGVYWCNSSLDGGVTWLSNPVAVPALATPYHIVTDGSSLLAVWETAAAGNPLEAWCIRSSDAGRTWSNPPVRIGTSRPSSPGSQLVISAGRNGWFTATAIRRECWQLPCVYVHTRYVSNDGGQTWRGSVGVSHPAGVSRPHFVESRSALLGIWRDTWPGSGPVGDPKVEWLAGGRSLGGSAPGTGGNAPLLGVDRLPVYGAPVDVHLRNGLPGAPALLAIGFSRVPTPFLGGLLTVEPGAHVILTLGTASGPTPGQASRQLPFAAAYWFYEFACQAFVLDPGASGGVAVSNGLELRVY